MDCEKQFRAVGRRKIGRHYRHRHIGLASYFVPEDRPGPTLNCFPFLSLSLAIALSVSFAQHVDHDFA